MSPSYHEVVDEENAPLLRTLTAQQQIAARIPQLAKPPVYHHPPTEPTPFQRLILIIGSTSAITGAVCFALGLGFDNFYLQLVGCVLAPTGAALFFVFLCLYQMAGRSMKDPLVVYPPRYFPPPPPRMVVSGNSLRQTSLLLGASGSSQRLSVVNEMSCEASTGSSITHSVQASNPNNLENPSTSQVAIESDKQNDATSVLRETGIEVAREVSRTLHESLRSEEPDKPKDGPRGFANACFITTL